MKVEIDYSDKRSSPHRVVYVEGQERGTIALAGSKKGAEEIMSWLSSSHNNPIAVLLKHVSKANVDPFRFKPLLDLIEALEAEEGKKEKSGPRNYTVGSVQRSDSGKKGEVQKKRCSQCNRTSVLVTAKTKECLNGCGPEALMKLFRF